MGAFEWLFSVINGSLRLTSIVNACYSTYFLIQVIIWPITYLHDSKWKPISGQGQSLRLTLSAEYLHDEICIQHGPFAHYGDVIMGAIASQITSLTIIYLTIYSDADQRKHQSSASLAFVQGIHRGPVNSPHKWPVTRKMFSFWWRPHVISYMIVTLYIMVDKQW